MDKYDDLLSVFEGAAPEIPVNLQLYYKNLHHCERNQELTMKKI